MNNRTVFYILIIFFVAFAALVGFEYFKSSSARSVSNTEIKKDFAEPIIGSYAHDTTASVKDAINFQHSAITIAEQTSDEVIQQALTALASTKPNLITIKTVGANQENILQKFVDGNFDAKIKTICTSLAEIQQPIYLRWNPEMEVPVTLYPWQFQSSALYAEAFRRFAKLTKQLLPNAQIVWGPAGYPGAEEYWPGNDVVDVISLTVNSKSELQATGYPHTKDMTVLLKRKIHRVRFMNKPILILGTEDTNTNNLVKEFLPVAINETEREQATIYATIAPDSAISTPVATRTANPVIGVYDPKQLLLTAEPVKVEHLFIDLGNVEDGLFLKEFTAITARKHDVILTVEPWKDKSYKKGDNVLLNTINGKYDSIFKKLYSVLSNSKQTVYLRFAHEMEIPIERYPWQSQDPVVYSKAFRHFMNYGSVRLKNVKRIWGPAGDRGSVEWWPGGDVVDYISVAIYGLPDKNITDPQKQESFSTIYARKHHRMRFAHKPIFVTEFGVKGPEDLQMKWLDDAANVINNHKEIIGACYFNLADNPKAWGQIAAPDWSINRNTFISFTKEINAK
ncbi:hypothetical protein [Hymenobacter sp. YC55]|uniref:hypothetical protein n=1 Tax=Hymenobacter sp. YC55 TaxID=3034019 RepID=UPI0023F7C5CC|nr:hypothetical protein [Hymenobacter sp. YC55]MDF7812193.1 hypothetical protein [Hymenobacter sp. YC55]